MDIRPEAPGDAETIHALVAEAFGQALEADLIDRLREDGDVAISLVAVDDGDIVGHVLFSPMTAPFRALGLGPVAVLPARERTGIARRLIVEGVALARGAGWQGVFVLGEPAFYRRFGFDPALAQDFVSPYAGPYLMALALDGELPVLTGKVDYAPAFAELG